MSQQSIQEFYKGKSVFITGSTGFIGKVLVEKLLWSCHGLDKVYIIVRTKKGKEVDERLDDIVKSPIFDRIRSKRPELLNKIVPLEGDITKENLGLSNEDLELFFEKVNVIFHSAASIRMDEPLKIAIENNTMPVKKLLALSRKIRNLEAFVHISTAFSNWYRDETNEIPYIPSYDPNDIIKLSNSLPDDIQAKIEKILLNPGTSRPFPNTYTYSKYLAEAILTKEGDGIPRAIVRPSIVVPTYNEPISGFVDNFGGNAERIISVSKGLVHFMHAQPNFVADFVPADLVVNCTIATAWKIATDKSKEVQVFNATTGMVNPLTWQQFFNDVNHFARIYPFDKFISLPKVKLSTNLLSRIILPGLQHYLPAILIDASRRIVGKKPIMMKLHEMALRNFSVVQFAILGETKFRNENAQKLAQSISKSDQKEFPFDMRTIDWKKCNESNVLGVKRYLLKEDVSEEAFQRGRQRIKRFQFINKGVRYAFLGTSLLLVGGLAKAKIQNSNEEN